MLLLKIAAGLIYILGTLSDCAGQQTDKPRARQIGIPFDGTPGVLNGITDVPGVEVGYATLIRDTGMLIAGKGPVRTGVTVILPKGKTDSSYPAAWFSLNGDGEMTGLPYVEDYGTGYGPIGITNTNSVGIVKDAIGAWCVKNFSTGDFIDFSFGIPIVGETWDGMLNDINGFHVQPKHVFQALDSAKSGKIAEGNVGGGTGMALYGFKGGSGSASRVFQIDAVQYTLGVFVQANFGGRKELTIAGVPVGKEITDLQPVFNKPARKDGSIIVIVATDAPLLPGQLKLIAKRIAMGMARTGTFAHNGSGDIFLALSTAAPQTDEKTGKEIWSVITKSKIDPLYKATVEATEEAIINALVAAEDMTGINNNKFYAIPQERLKQILKKYNRLNLK